MKQALLNFLLATPAFGRSAGLLSVRSDESSMAGVMQEPLGTEENSGLTFETIGFYVCAVLLLIVLCAFGAVGKKSSPPPPGNREALDERKKVLAAQFAELKQIEGDIKEASPEEEPLIAAPSEPMDYDKMMKTFAQQVSDKMNEKMKNEGAVKKIMEDRMQNFQGKAKTFMLNEMNTTAGDLMKAVDAEEALLLLEWNEAVEANFPPASVVIAGLLSPTMLTFALINHILQGLLLYLPVVCLCIAAIIIDEGVPCPGVPTIFVWLYVHMFLAVVLFIGHFVQMIRIISGKSALNRKAEQVGAKLKEIESHQEHGISDLRELFVGNSVLVQQALLVEDYVRKSIFQNIIGFFTLIWVLCTVWTFIVVIGWTFIPGVAAFHASAQATAGDAFCGTWMTIFTARLVSIMGLLFLLVNIITVIRWIMDLMIHSASFEKNLLKQAKHVDDGAGGVPVCQILAKAIVLRGSSDTIYAELNVCANENIHLRRQKQRVEAELNELDTRIQHFTNKQETLQAKATKNDGDTGFGGIIKNLECPHSSSEWKDRGIAAVHAAEARALPPAEEEAKDLNKFVERIQEAVDSIMNSDEFKQAQQQAAEAAEAAEKKAMELAEKAQEVAAAAAQQAQEAAQKAMKAAEDLANDPEVQKAIADAKARAQEAVEKGVEKGKELAKEGQKMAEDVYNDPEVQKAIAEAQAKGKEIVDKGVEKGKEVVEKGKEVAEKVKTEAEKVDVEELKKQGSEAADKASKAASEAAESAKKASKKK